MSEHSPRKSPSLAEQIRRSTGLNPARCYQCGKCSAGCPMAEEMGGMPPHAILRLVQLDRHERVLGSEAIWLCLTCETCSTRCPNEVDPARIIDALRELALRRDPAAPPRAIRGFHRAFLGQIRANGRLFEAGLVAGYKLRTGDLFSDVASAPVMLLKGKLALLPKRIEGLDEVRRIFDACERAAVAGPDDGEEHPAGDAVHHG